MGTKYEAPHYAIFSTLVTSELLGPNLKNKNANKLKIITLENIG
jgi:hypothetical protein